MIRRVFLLQEPKAVDGRLQIWVSDVEELNKDTWGSQASPTGSVELKPGSVRRRYGDNVI